MDNQEIETRFTYHSLKPGQSDLYVKLRNKAKELANFINIVCPESREKSFAITKIESAVFWANASIARRT